MSSLFVNGKLALEEVELIIFDKDGTLIDIHHYWGSIIKIRSEMITKKWFNGTNHKNFEICLISLMGVDIKTGKLKPDGPIGVKSRKHIVSIVKDYICQYAQTVSKSDVELLFKEVDKITECNLSPFLKILPGVEILLEKMKKLGVKAAITSTDITNRAIKAMEVLGLKHYFSEIIGGDAVNKTKPFPDLANLALSRIGSNPSSAVVIGDHPVDVSMGSSANINTNIGVLNGISKRGSFLHCHCKVVENLLDIDIR